MAEVALRSGKDRLRYTLTFEVILMLMLIPAGMLFFDKPMADIGALGVILSVKAMIVNLIYNWIFDKIDARYGRMSSNRTTLGRIFHAFGFEAFLTVSSLPFYIWLLEIGVIEALLTDIVVTTFVVAYTYVFTLIYDRKYPIH